jgi:hypothetical protein
MRRKLEAKLELDGIQWDELTLKPNLSNAVLLRLRALRDQLGYKLPELLAARARDQAHFTSPSAVREILVGDDSESDAFVYSLYADVCAGAVDGKELERVFEAGRAYGRSVAVSRRAVAMLQTAPVVDRILIHLDGQTPPSQFARYGDRLVPFYNYLQAAFVLLERSAIAPAATLRIAAEFLDAHGFSADTVARSYADLRRRGHADGSVPNLLDRALNTPSSLREDALAQLASAVEQMKAGAPLPDRAPSMPRIDYVSLAGRYSGGQNRRRPGQRFG